jgi:stage V sporulation protein AE
MAYLRAFVVGGLICVVGQIIMDNTKLTPGHILVIFVTSGVILTFIGVYEPLVKFAEAGATVPLTGFGYALCNGAIEGVNKDGLVGAFTGGIQATAGGVAGAILFGYIMAVVSSPKSKK